MCRKKKTVDHLTNMTGPQTVSTILDVVNLSREEKKEVESPLVNFVDLKEDEKKAARPAAIEKGFPRVFKDNALLETSTKFEE
jgi:hypothetical protein